MKTFTITTIGCKANQYDSQLIREGLLARGCRECGNGNERAEICVVNTCTVTNSSEAKSRRAVRRVVREHPGATVIVTGCCAESSPGDFASLPGVRLVLGNRLKRRIPRIAGGKEGTDVHSVSGLAGHTRAFVKIQDGCDFRCSFCIVPMVRGRPRSRSLDEVVGEAEVLASGGYAELVLSGIHLGAYGADRGERSALEKLIRELERIDGVNRIRLSSIEPLEVSEELVEIMASGGKLCPHLHIPLQSGDHGVLRAMKRAYSPAAYREAVARIRRRLPDVSLTTDVIVGFPSESDEAFRHTIELVREAAFSRVHIFPYSPRPGTPAWRFGDPIPAAIKDRRRRTLAEAAGETARAFRKRFLGRRVEVLVQGASKRHPGKRYGITREYLRAYFEGRNAGEGAVCGLLVEGLAPDGLRGRLENLENGNHACGSPQGADGAP